MAERRQRSTLGDNLRAAREDAGLTRAALASRSGVAEPTIARIELYGQSPRFSTLEAIAAALGMSVGDLTTEPVGAA